MDDYTAVFNAEDKRREEEFKLSNLFDRIFYATSEPTEVEIRLVIQQAKRVRACDNVLVRELARLRDATA